MRYSRFLRSIMAVALGMVICGGAYADGGGQARLGYVFLDEEGNAGVNQETYNLYEGAVLSLDQFRYLFDNGLNVAADLKNMTLNNRNLSAAVSKPGLFSLSLFNHQYRRIYNFGGDKFTRRRASGGRVEVSPANHFKIFAGYNRTDKHGRDFMVLSPVSDTVINATDFTHTALQLGGQAFYPFGTLRLMYRRTDFTDDAGIGNDRKGDAVTVTAFAPIPKFERVVVSGGYYYRRDEHDVTALKLTTNQGWAGVRGRIANGVVGEYRFLAARTKHTGNSLETDNFVNTVSVGRNWAGYGGFRVGYENRINDDLTDRSVANSVMLAGWYRLYDKLMLRGRLSTRIKEVKTGATLVGDEDFTRHQISLRHTEKGWGDIWLRYQGRIKTNDDIKTRVEYNAVTAAVNLKREGYGRLNFTYSYYLGSFENRGISEPDRFEFSDHVLTGMIHPIEYRHIQAAVGGTYYRSRRDRDTEKIGFDFTARYDFTDGYMVEFGYQAFNYDDFLTTDRYYTGNVFRLHLIKDFTL